MSDIAIRVEGLSKQFRIGSTERYRTFRDTLTDTLAAPFRFVRNGGSHKTPAETIWALKDVSFEVKHGEVIGIIGRNGAGKSTLLKILSRITGPTKGHAEIHGRVGSLLEVGTGFHPELTGRENTFLNGAILGMKKAEILRRFDEIVAFAEVEKFIDTPVKHYSSGMYLRLAFAVAAHLQTDILVVDEVLAVGDAEFQKRCLGKMRDAGKNGRTVLFVSHNLAALKSLTSRGIVFKGGRISFNGPANAAIQDYFQSLKSDFEGGSRGPWGRGAHTAVRGVRMLDADGQATTKYIPGEPLRIEVDLETDGAGGMSLELFLKDVSLSPIGMASSYQFHRQMLPRSDGAYACRFEMEPMWLGSGRYTLDVRTSRTNIGWDHCVEEALGFEVPFSNPLGCELDFKQAYGYGPLALLASSPVRFDPILKVNGLPRHDRATEKVR
jgi:lipopolysaccharide transport system ATP-binding protein